MTVLDRNAVFLAEFCKGLFLLASALWLTMWFGIIPGHASFHAIAPLLPAVALFAMLTGVFENIRRNQPFAREYYAHWLLLEPQAIDQAAHGYASPAMPILQAILIIIVSQKLELEGATVRRNKFSLIAGLTGLVVAILYLPTPMSHFSTLSGLWWLVQTSCTITATAIVTFWCFTSRRGSAKPTLLGIVNNTILIAYVYHVVTVSGQPLYLHLGIILNVAIGSIVYLLGHFTHRIDSLEPR